MEPLCEDVYVGGIRVGQPCPYNASTIIMPRYGTPHLVCGYHARTYTPEAQYPLWANLAQLRRLQWNALNDRA